MSNEFTPENDMNSLCRVCGSVITEGLVAIFGSHGIEELGSKISKYLPIKICPDDVLPTQICAPCANTVLSWDLLYNRCLSADKKFTLLLSAKKIDKSPQFNRAEQSKNHNHRSGEFVVFNMEIGDVPIESSISVRLLLKGYVQPKNFCRA